MNEETVEENYLIQNLFWILSLFLQLDQQTFRRDQNLQGDRKDQVPVTQHQVK